ncbi:MAG: type II secretion system F family protein [Casimicrobiaceae bacterium]|nr:type II secretion system F family protein [Casimicrobiaceae bacterium]MCX8098492.1 type II secretion system F family protein [Casimicrobiaceae bacterium]MDW8311595.1 type II secretion system F family protein [Burkholderiales bacterium]
MAIAAKAPGQSTRSARETVKASTFQWEGIDRAGKKARGEMRAASETVVINSLRRQGITQVKVKKVVFRGGGRIKEKDVTLFTRQLATMMRAGVPLLQSFDIAARSSSNPRFARLLLEVKNDVEAGNSLSTAFRRHPMTFDELYCNLVAAGEASGTLESVLDRLAQYKEKVLALKGKIKSAMFYPATVIIVAIVVVAIIMWFVIPAFKQVFSSFGANLPWLTELVVAISDWFVQFFYVVIGIPIVTAFVLWYLWKRVPAFKTTIDRLSLKLPLLGPVIEKAAVARWARTLSTMFSAGVPLVDSLQAVQGAAGNSVFADATKKIQASVSTGTALTVAMDETRVFPVLALQMTRIGEETGALDSMLGKVADFYEREVDEAVAALSSLIEPLMIVVLGIVIGTIVIAMYLPIFKLGSVV